MKILTFVIPAYNSEQFLHKCIPSMLAPAILEKLEILVVNDGSKDQTAAVAESYCRLYPDTVRLISQENKGHGGALNAGCAAAQGKYLKVIDADDWVVTDNLAPFLAFLENCQSDVILTHHHTIDISNDEIKHWRSYPEVFGKAYSFDEIMPQWRNFDRSLTFHGITYRTEFYHARGHQLLEHVFYEDHEYATYPCCYAQSITPLDLFIYEYRIGDVNQSVSDAIRLKRISHLEAVLRRMIEKSSSQDLSAAGLTYAARKTQELFLSYLAVTLLIHPDKKAGRQMAEAMLAEMRRDFPQAATLAEKKYRIFLLLNRLHISKQTWETFLKSGFYRKLRKSRDFS